MIPRTLVPWNARPAEASSPEEPRKTVTALDDRTLIPAYFVQGPLETRSSIPASLPLESVAARLVIPRDLPIKPFEAPGARRASFRDADARIAIPADAAPLIIAPRAHSFSEPLPEVVDPDIFTTGDAQLLASPDEPHTFRGSNFARVSSSIAFHVLLVAFLLLQPKLFPERPHTQDELEISRQNLSMIFLPHSLREPPRIPSGPVEPRSSQIHVDLRALREFAPNVPPQPPPGKAEPERVVKELPEAPKPHDSPAPVQPEPQLNASNRPLRLESPDEQPKPQGLILPRFSPGKALEEAARGAARDSTNRPIVSGGQVPGGGSGRPGGGGGPPTAASGVDILTPTEGVDFSSYVTRMIATVKRNWYAVMPESVRLGDRGVVVLVVKVMRDGSVASGDPRLIFSSGKSHLDSAAASALRASNPFEPLPPAFSGPFVEFRWMFLYNVDPKEVQ
jgi:outer membrane biosynthesis protein TonB